MTDPTVRVARPDDTGQISAVAERGWYAAHGDILSEQTIDRVLREWYDPENTRDAIQRDEVGYFVADVDGNVIGYISGGRSDDPDVARLAAIYIDPDYWREGVGTALVDRFHEFCRSRGYDRVQLRVLAENERAQSFYRRHGYEAVEKEKTELFGESAVEVEYIRSLE